MQQGSRSFALASLFLPPKGRERAYLLYEWCRRCDDCIDDARDPEAASHELERLERDSGAPDWVSLEHQADFLAGLRMDVQHARPASFSDLELYCYRVAGVVGLMMCPLIGAKSEQALIHASALGKAMQLTNIARDIQADARMGRIYVPSAMLPGVDARLLATEPERALPAVRVLLEQADHWYREGLLGLAWLPLRAALAIAVAGCVYRRIGHQLLESALRDPACAFRRRTVVPALGKLIAVMVAVGWVIRVKLSHRLQADPVESAS
jgi:phytoene synthase